MWTFSRQKLPGPRPWRTLLWFGALACVVLRPDAAPRPAKAARALPAPASAPNLLIVIADDHRGGTLGIDGDPRQATPRLDDLARQGVRFSRAYCNAPVCTASRQSLITGKLPHAVGVTRLTTPLPAKAVTMGDWLGNLGYDTAAIGKMHFNSRRHHGFRERVDLPEWEKWLRIRPPKGGDRRRSWLPLKEPARDWLNADCRPAGLPEEALDSTFFADQAIDYLRTPREKPFALVLGFYDPHSPFRFPNGWKKRFRPESFPVPPVSTEDLEQRPLVFRDLTARDAQGIQAAYYTSLSYLDHEVGRVLDALDASGQREKTVVVFLGDNGYMLGEHARFEKHCFYEPAVRVPMIVSWPGRLPAERKVDAMVELVDLLPTLYELAGVAAPADLQGRSLVPLLRGDAGATGREVIFSEYLENEEAMTRSGRFKLVVGTGRRKRLDGYETREPLPGPYLRLYDEQADPGETTDLSDRPETARVRQELLDRLHDRLVGTRDGLTPVPRGLSPIEELRWCLVPRDVEAEAETSP